MVRIFMFQICSKTFPIPNHLISYNKSFGILSIHKLKKILHLSVHKAQERVVFTSFTTTPSIQNI